MFTALLLSNKDRGGSFMAKSKSKSGGKNKRAGQAKIPLSQLKGVELKFLKARAAYARKHYPVGEACVPFGKVDTLSDYSVPNTEFNISDPMCLENRYNKWCEEIDEMVEESKELANIGWEYTQLAREYAKGLHDGQSVARVSANRRDSLAAYHSAMQAVCLQAFLKPDTWVEDESGSCRGYGILSAYSESWLRAVFDTYAHDISTKQLTGSDDASKSEFLDGLLSMALILSKKTVTGKKIDFVTPRGGGNVLYPVSTFTQDVHSLLGEKFEDEANDFTNLMRNGFRNKLTVPDYNLLVALSGMVVDIDLGVRTLLICLTRWSLDKTVYRVSESMADVATAGYDSSRDLKQLSKLPASFAIQVSDTEMITFVKFDEYLAIMVETEKETFVYRLKSEVSLDEGFDSVWCNVFGRITRPETLLGGIGFGFIPTANVSFDSKTFEIFCPVMLPESGVLAMDGKVCKRAHDNPVFFMTDKDVADEDKERLIDLSMPLPVQDMQLLLNAVPVPDENATVNSAPASMRYTDFGILQSIHKITPKFKTRCVLKLREALGILYAMVDGQLIEGSKTEQNGVTIVEMTEKE